MSTAPEMNAGTPAETDAGRDDSKPRDGTREVNGIRLYQTAGGEFPSVTSILKKTMPYQERKRLQDWRKKVGAEEAQKIANAAAGRGTKLHAMCEHYAEALQRGERLYTGATTAAVIRNGQTVVIGEGPWWESVAPFMARVSAPELIESKLWHPRGFAGSLDLCASVDGVPAVIDFKTASKRKDPRWITDHYMQVSAYVAGVNHVFRKLQGRTDSVKSAWIVIGYEDREADAFYLSAPEITPWYQAFCRRVDEFKERFAV